MDLELLPYAEYAASLNRKRTAAGVLFRDADDRVLLVETTYKAEWEIPGGVVEAEEAPWTTAAREVREEVGIDRPLGRLLVIDHVPTRGVMPEGLAFVFDGGVVDADEVGHLQVRDPEVRSIGLYPLDHAEEVVSPQLFRRLSAAFTALRTGELVLQHAG